ncbi:5158_t:CDS:2, partial [Racocetra fulgida]
MSNATQISLPFFQLLKKPNKKDLLCQNIVEWIRNNGGDTCGIEKMKVRAIYPPKEFEKFFNRSDPSKKSQFTWLFPLLEKFSKCLVEYSTYLHEQNIEISKNHQLEIPVRLLDDSISIKVYD